MGPHVAPRPPEQGQGPHHRLRRAGRRGRGRRPSATTTSSSQIPPGPHLGDLVVEAEDLRKGYGDRLLIDDLNFCLPPGGIVGVIGPNGAGKTTLFRMIVGQEKPDAGTLRVGDTVAARLRRSEPRRARRRQHRLRGDHRRSRTTWSWAAARCTARAYVAGFNFKGSDQQKKVGELSGGERNRVHLAKLLSSGGNVLLLDEPTNDLDVDTLRALEEALLDFAGCAVVISHDRWFLDRIATHILAFEGDTVVLVRGQLQRLRGRPAQAPRRRRRPAAPHPLQAARPRLTA